ncbi:MAG: ABC transporter substrate-binding protein [Hyphomicrobiales bacterium]|nr:ABC transporter substrate-binding protein [Hyphomicrobiales bacterium]
MLAACAFLALFSLARAADPLTVKVGVLRQPHNRETISILDTPAEDETLAGAELGADDDNTTGQFTNQKFETIDAPLTADDDIAQAVTKFADAGALLVIADLPADRFLKAVDAGKPRGMIFINSGAPDENLREEDCRANAFHSAPSRGMLADGLAQYLVWKQWRKWLLVKGSHPQDEALADAYRRAAKKFGAKIVEERTFADTGGGRSSDSGVVQVQRQMPVATQNAPSYDVLVAADESDVFAGYLPYRTWDPRPVAGSAGLVPESWDPSFDQWGGAQLQNRFYRRFKRPMRALDAQAWTAMRMFGEAATRTSSADPKAIAAYMAGPDFEIAAFKGQKLTVRPWNLQLRQPILLGDGRTIVSVSPQEGFLHQTSTLDTLGRDRPETTCKLK